MIQLMVTRGVKRCYNGHAKGFEDIENTFFNLNGGYRSGGLIFVNNL
jgi:hypothetical protein